MAMFRTQFILVLGAILLGIRRRGVALEMTALARRAT